MMVVIQKISYFWADAKVKVMHDDVQCVGFEGQEIDSGEFLVT